ncbi:MerR family DNA-binding transcriptional regulator [Thiobacter aerophilum]|uniref:MerR family DNA-binding transcriptional regulator n=1 Tax=Thiobacter aerophilum TaxID=3121275 RepID=A0ABV0EB47_9BURK
MKAPATYTIGKLAAQAGVTADAVRYYEKEALLAPASRTSAGYRLYDGEALRRRHFAQAALAAAPGRHGQLDLFPCQG